MSNKNVKPSGKTAGNVSGNNKKVVVTNNSAPKKKRSCCCSCLISILVAFVIFVGAGVGAGWYFGDKYAKEYLDMGIGDVLGVAKDVLTSKGKTIVTNSHAGTNTSLFENELKNAFFLKDSANLNKSGIVDMFTSSSSGGSTESGKLNSKGSYLSAALNEVPGSDGVDEESTGQNPMVEYASSLLNAQNMDLDALESYDEAHHSDYILNITDKQLAAFISDVMKNYLDSSSLAESLSETLPGVKPSELLAFEQLTFYGAKENPHMKLTLSLNARKAASAYISEQTGLSIGWATYPMLPKLFYFTADISLNAAEGESGLKLYINNTDDAKMERLYKLVRNVTKLTGNEINPQALIDEKVGGILTPIADALMNYGDMSEIAQGKIKIDIFQMAIDLAGLNDAKTEEERLTSSDLIYTLKYLLTSDFEKSINTKHTWIDQYKKTGVADKTYYKPADLTDEYTLIDYEQEMLNEIADKYLIDLTSGTPDDTSDDKTFKELMGLFGMGGGGSGDLMDWIAPDKLGELAKKEGDIGVVITDRMLGAMFNAQIGSLMGEAGVISQLNPKTYQIIITEGDNLTRTYMEAGLEINLKAYASSGGSSLFGMLGGLLPESVMLSIKMEITPNVAEDYVYTPSELYYNDLTREEVAHLLATLSKLGVSMSEEELVGPMETSLRDVIKNMKTQMPGLTFTPSGVLMADLFTLTLDLEINKDKENPLMYDVVSGAPGAKEEMTGEDLKEVISVLYEGVSEDSLADVALNQHEFLQQVINKYFLDNNLVKVGIAPENNSSNVIYVNTFDELKNIFNKDNFDASLMDKPKLKHTADSSDSLRPVISESELANIIMGTMDSAENAAKFANMKIISFEIAEDKTIRIIAEAQTDALFGNNTAFKKFLSVEKLYLCITVDSKNTVDGTYSNGNPITYYDTTVTINNMTEQELAKLKALIGHYDPNNEGMNFEDRAKDIGNFIYDQFKTFSSSMGNNCEFVAHGVKIANIFDLIAESQPYDDDGDPETPGIPPASDDVRGALQGLSKNENDEWLAEFSDYNYTETGAGGIIFNRPEPIASDALAVSPVTLADNELAYALINGVDPITKMSTINTDISLVQLNLYSGARDINDDFDFRCFGLDSYNTGKEYAVFTFALSNLSIKPTEPGAKNNYESLLESAIYFTVIYERESAGQAYSLATSGGEGYLRINNLTLAQQNVLFKIANVNDRDLKDQRDACGTFLTNSTLLNGVIGYANGVGTIEITFPSI